MRVCTPAEMRDIESRVGIPEERMIESAGAVAAREIILRYWPELKRGPVAVFCGPGNNGADGLVIARHLISAGVAKLQIYHLANMASGALNLSRFSLIIDALFGIGLSRGLKGEPVESLINSINKSGCPVVSVDVPSGLDCTTGRAEGAAVKAQLTLTFTLPKVGFFTAQGTDLCGILRVLPVGFPPPAILSGANSYCLFTERWARKLLPARPLSGNKATFGHLAVCAGRPGYWGAGVLASQAAFRIGAGYVTWASQTAPVEELRFHPEVLTMSLEDLYSSGRKFSAFVVGPGLGADKKTFELLEKMKVLQIPAVLDADALTVVAKEKMNKLPRHWILTPHTGELSRLLGISSEEIEQNRFAAVQAAAAKFGCHVLLKGFRTLVLSGKKTVIIASGNPALAKAGTGDVLSGMIGGLLAQGLSVWRAACLGAYLHGRLADEWVRSGKDVASLVASDLADTLPSLLARFRASGRSLQGETLE